jgi:hypothetical protein
MWHPHLHILADSQWFTHADLKKLWSAATGDSSIVWIQSLHSAAGGAAYASRYASRSSSLAVLPKPCRALLVSQCAGHRMLGTFGHISAAKILHVEKSERGDWEDIGSWSTVVSLASTSADAADILNAWRTKTSLPPGIDLHMIDALVDNPDSPPEPEAPPLRARSIQKDLVAWQTTPN